MLPRPTIPSQREGEATKGRGTIRQAAPTHLEPGAIPVEATTDALDAP